MVTRLPGTFGTRGEPIGSTTPSGDPAGSLAMQIGSGMAAITSMANGTDIPSRKAQARPAKTARYSGRNSTSCDNLNAADIDTSLCAHSRAYDVVMTS